MKLKNLSVALVGAGLAVAIAPPSFAGALATSVLKMADFQLLHSDGSAYDITSDFRAIVPASSANIAASYNSPLGPTNAGGPTPTGQLDLAPVCAGPGCPGVANNAFPYLTNPPAGQFVAADQNESGSPVLGQVYPVGHPLAGLPIPLGATVESGSWAILSGEAAGPNASSATNALSTTFLFTLAQADSITFSFDAAHYQESFLSSNINFPGAAQTTSQFFFKITTTDPTTGAQVTVFDFTPDGIAGNATGATAETDPFTLNTSTSRIAPFNQVTGEFRRFGAGPGVPRFDSFSATTGVLLAGVEYQLEATLKTTASAAFVPEPGVLGLLGLGLLGLGVTMRRKNIH